MLKRILVLLVLVLALVLSACGGEPQTCGDIADVTVDLMQNLIDDVEKEVGDMTVEDLLATQGELPPVEEFRTRRRRSTSGRWNSNAVRQPSRPSSPTESTASKAPPRSASS